MMFRTLIGGLAGGIVMFAWFSIAHVSEFGETGISNMPREILVTSTLDSGVGGTGGLYVFPASETAGPDVPSGFMVYDPDNIFYGSMQNRILLELAKDIGLAMVLAVLMLMAGRHDFPFRIGFSAGAGLLAGFSAHLSHSIWFGFPWGYALSQGAIIFVGFVLAGLVIAIVMPRPVNRAG